MTILQFTSCGPNLYDFLSSVDYKDDVLKNLSPGPYKWNSKVSNVILDLFLLYGQKNYSKHIFVFQEDSYTGLERHKGKQTTFLIQVWKDMMVSIFIFGWTFTMLS